MRAVNMAVTKTRVFVYFVFLFLFIYTSDIGEYMGVGGGGMATNFDNAIKPFVWTVIRVLVPCVHVSQR